MVLEFEICIELPGFGSGASCPIVPAMDVSLPPVSIGAHHYAGVPAGAHDPKKLLKFYSHNKYIQLVIFKFNKRKGSLSALASIILHFIS